MCEAKDTLIPYCYLEMPVKLLLQGATDFYRLAGTADENSWSHLPSIPFAASK